MNWIILQSVQSMNHDDLLSVSEDSEKFNRDAAAVVVVCQCVATASVALSAPLSAPHSGPVKFSFVTCESCFRDTKSSVNRKHLPAPTPPHKHMKYLSPSND